MAEAERLAEVTGRRRMKEAVAEPTLQRLGWNGAKVVAVAETRMCAKHLDLFVA